MPRPIACLVIALAVVACARPRPGLLIGAGDIARCQSDTDEQTAAMVERALADAKERKRPAVVVTMGDNVYSRGTTEEFANCYAPSWGRKAILDVTRPSPGNHDYGTPGAAPYYAFFGERAGPPGVGYYTFTVAGWRFFSLNSELRADTAATRRQLDWLREQLATAKEKCTLAYWHKPVYSSSRGVNRYMLPVWQLLDAAGADVILAGHDHTYERFEKQRADGTPDEANGIRQFVVGTGGASLYEFENADSVKNSAVKQNDQWGLLTMTLEKGGYAWTFTDLTGAVRDEGKDRCR